jgi:hypothetical protein
LAAHWQAKEMIEMGSNRNYRVSSREPICLERST